jgi:general secretion pathway protein H
MTPISGCKFLKPANPKFLSAGFTLLELMLVLTIIAMASILVVPNVGNLEARTFSAQVRQATSLLNYARRIAVVQGQPATASFYAAVIDEQATTASTTRNSVGNWESHGAAVRYRDSTDREIEVLEKIDITFYPEGGSTGGTLLLTQDDRLVTIIVDPFTGRVSTEIEEQ